MPLRPDFEPAVPRADRSKGGRPSFDHVLMFKVLILQTQNSLSDERTEFYLRDRLSWMRFLGLGLGDPVPDANTIWTFREALTKAGTRVSKSEVVMGEGALRRTGEFEVLVHLHADVETPVKVVVEPEPA